MELALVFAVGVLVLRLGLLVAGTLFCWFGYRLFARARALGGAEISVKDYFKLNLNQIGPGVFFSLFGAAILVYSIHKPPSLDLRDPVQAGSAAQPSSVSPPATGTSMGGRTAGTPPPAVARSVAIAGAGNAPAIAPDRSTELAASHQIGFVNRIDASGTVAAQDRKDLERISRQIRLSIMRTVWRADWGDQAEFELWVRDPSGRERNPNAETFFNRR